MLVEYRTIKILADLNTPASAVSCFQPAFMHVT